jgi:hypothetical protein
MTAHPRPISKAHIVSFPALALTCTLLALFGTTIALSAAEKKPPAGRTADKGKVPQRNQILLTSDFISFKDTGISTILPKGAVLHVPACSPGLFNYS